MTEADKARGIRLGYLTQSPGWPDLVKILNDLVNEAVMAANTFPGWDKDQKCDLMARQQAVSGMRGEIIKRVEYFLLAGSLTEGNNTAGPSTLADAISSSEDTRIPGTYERVT